MINALKELNEILECHELTYYDIICAKIICLYLLDRLKWDKSNSKYEIEDYISILNEAIYIYHSKDTPF